MPAFDPRSYATAFLLVSLAWSLLLCRFLAARTPRPAVLWGAAGYWTLLHLICVYGMLGSQRFEGALAQLTLFTFPWSMSLADTLFLQGFATLPDLAANYVRYVLCFGGMNALLLAGLLVLVLPDRGVARPGKEPAVR